MPASTPADFLEALPRWMTALSNGKEFSNHDKIQIFLLSRQACAWSEQGCIGDEDLQISMVYFFAELGALFSVDAVIKSFDKSFRLARKELGCFLELYVETDPPHLDDLLQPEGIFYLPEILKASPPLKDRYGNEGRQEGYLRRRRWEVPFFYILSRLIHDLLRKKSDLLTADQLVQQIERFTCKLGCAVLSSRDAGVGLFLFDLLVFGSDLPVGFTVDFVMKKLSLKCFNCLQVAADAARLSQYDIHARCVELFMQLDSEDLNDQQRQQYCTELFRGFAPVQYLDELEQTFDKLDSSTIQEESLRSRLSDSCYVLHMYLGCLEMKGHVIRAVQLASEMEKRAFLPLDEKKKAYEGLVEYYFRSCTLLHGTQASWQTSHAQSYVRFAGDVGFTVLLQSVHQLPKNFAPHFLPAEQQYIATACNKTVLALLVHKYGDKVGVSKFGLHYQLPVLSRERQIQWARDFMEQPNPIPASIDVKQGVDDVVRPDLYTMLCRVRGYEQTAVLVESESDEELEVATRDEDIMEVEMAAPEVAVEETESNDDDVVVVASDAEPDQEIAVADNEDEHVESEEENDAICIKDGASEEADVQEEVAQTEDADPHGLSQVEAGYDAEDSQDHSATEEEEERVEPFAPMIHDSPPFAPPEQRKRPAPPVVELASAHVDPGYEAEESQGNVDVDARPRQAKRRRLETGYEAEESQGHSEEEEEEVTEEMHTEDEQENGRHEVAITLLHERETENGAGTDIVQTGNQTLSDMSAADELTTGHDDDLGAESSEQESSELMQYSEGPTYLPTTPSTGGRAKISLYDFATAAYEDDTMQRAQFSRQPSGVTDMAVTGELDSQSGSIASADTNQNEVLPPPETASGVVDHVPHDLANAGLAERGEIESAAPQGHEKTDTMLPSESTRDGKREDLDQETFVPDSTGKQAPLMDGKPEGREHSILEVLREHRDPSQPDRPTMARGTPSRNEGKQHHQPTATKIDSPNLVEKREKSSSEVAIEKTEDIQTESRHETAEQDFLEFENTAGANLQVTEAAGDTGEAASKDISTAVATTTTPGRDSKRTSMERATSTSMVVDNVEFDEKKEHLTSPTAMDDKEGPRIESKDEASGLDSFEVKEVAVAGLHVIDETGKAANKDSCTNAVETPPETDSKRRAVQEGSTMVMQSVELAEKKKSSTLEAAMGGKEKFLIESEKSAVLEAKEMAVADSQGANVTKDSGEVVGEGTGGRTATVAVAITETEAKDENVEGTTPAPMVVENVELPEKTNSSAPEATLDDKEKFLNESKKSAKDAALADSQGANITTDSGEVVSEDTGGRTPMVVENVELTEKKNSSAPEAASGGKEEFLNESKRSAKEAALADSQGANVTKDSSEVVSEDTGGRTAAAATPETEAKDENVEGATPGPMVVENVELTEKKNSSAPEATLGGKEELLNESKKSAKEAALADSQGANVTKDSSEVVSEDTGARVMAVAATPETEAKDENVEGATPGPMAVENADLARKEGNSALGAAAETKKDPRNESKDESAYLGSLQEKETPATDLQGAEVTEALGEVTSVETSGRGVAASATPKKDTKHTAKPEQPMESHVQHTPVVQTDENHGSTSRADSLAKEAGKHPCATSMDVDSPEMVEKQKPVPSEALADSMEVEEATISDSKGTKTGGKSAEKGTFVASTSERAEEGQGSVRMDTEPRIGIADPAAGLTRNHEEVTETPKSMGDAGEALTASVAASEEHESAATDSKLHRPVFPPHSSQSGKEVAASRSPGGFSAASSFTVASNVSSPNLSTRASLKRDLSTDEATPDASSQPNSKRLKLEPSPMLGHLQPIHENTELGASRQDGAAAPVAEMESASPEERHSPELADHADVVGERKQQGASKLTGKPPLPQRKTRGTTVEKDSTVQNDDNSIASSVSTRRRSARIQKAHETATSADESSIASGASRSHTSKRGKDSAANNDEDTVPTTVVTRKLASEQAEDPNAHETQEAETEAGDAKTGTDGKETDAENEASVASSRLRRSSRTKSAKKAAPAAPSRKFADRKKAKEKEDTDAEEENSVASSSVRRSSRTKPATKSTPAASSRKPAGRKKAKEAEDAEEELSVASSTLRRSSRRNSEAASSKKEATPTQQEEETDAEEEASVASSSVRRSSRTKSAKKVTSAASSRKSAGGKKTKEKEDTDAEEASVASSSVRGSSRTKSAKKATSAASSRKSAGSKKTKEDTDAEDEVSIASSTVRRSSRKKSTAATSQTESGSVASTLKSSRAKKENEEEEDGPPTRRTTRKSSAKKSGVATRRTTRSTK